MEVLLFFPWASKLEHLTLKLFSHDGDMENCLHIYGLHVGKGFLFLSLSLFHAHTHTHTHTHINRVYPVLCTRRPLASRPEKTSLEAIGCPILFQAPRSQPHLFNAYIQSWGHEVGMWQGARRALDSGIISAQGCCDVCELNSERQKEKIKRCVSH